VLVRATIALACPLVLLASCGDSRTPVPDLTRPASAGVFRTLGYPAAGLVVRAPSSWSVVGRRAPLIATISSGPAVVALWRFRHETASPATAAALGRARVALIAAARRRDHGLRLIRASTATVGRLPAIELDAIERIRGEVRRVRSTHVFTSGAEIVLDEYAPPSLFPAVDRAVFSPVKRSLRMSPVAAGS
jgi:hypothetical protein